MEHPITMDDLGVPLFLETPIYMVIIDMLIVPVLYILEITGGMDIKVYLPHQITRK